jgi:hypothetical protein
VTSDRDGSFDDGVNGTNSGGFRTALRGQLSSTSASAPTSGSYGYSEKDGDCCSPDVLPGAVSTRFSACSGALRTPTRSTGKRRIATLPVRGDQYDLL